MAVNVYINFNGNCREAVDFYAQVFETEKAHIMTYGEAPSTPGFTLPMQAKNLVMHARLNIDGSYVMFSDALPGMSFLPGNNISLAVVSKDIDQIKSRFNKLKDGGSVILELQETFWSKCYGSVKDKFGIEWQVSHEGEEMQM